MATWASLAGFSGYYTSPDFSFSFDGDGAISSIAWDSITPIGTSAKVETSVSLNGGMDWSDWKFATNGGNIPDVTPTSVMSNFKIRYRVFMNTNNKLLTPIFHKGVSFYFEPVISFDNKGDSHIRPEVWIEKTGNGDFSIINTSNNNDEFKFISLIDEESLYINGEREEIETSLPTKYRYKEFNDNYLTLLKGVNVLRVKGKAKIWFRHQEKLKQG